MNRTRTTSATRSARCLAALCALVAVQVLAQNAGSGLTDPRTKANTSQRGLTLAAGEGDKKLGEWKAYGGYQFSQTWGAEVRYSDWGRRNPAAVDNPATQGSQWNIAATGNLPLSRGFSLTGRLGYERTEIASSPYCLSAACGTFIGSRQQGARAGIGLRYSFSESWCLRFDYDNVNPLSDASAPPGKGDSWSARIKYTF